MQAHRVSIPAFTLTNTCESNEDGATARRIESNIGSAHYYYRSTHKGHAQTVNINQMQLVVRKDGSPWAIACTYLLDRVTTEAGSASPSTLITIADDLAAFRRFLDEEQVDYKLFPRLKFARPTYWYHGSLMILIRSGAVALSTARRRIHSVMGFYRWLESERNFKPAHAMWNERDMFVKFDGHAGRQITRTVRSTDVRVRATVQDDPFDGEIRDGGRLKPLKIDAQKALIDVLIEVGNTEMTLLHLIAMFTGARIQSILTMKVLHVCNKKLVPANAEIPIPCGIGTGVDTKNDKQLVLFFPKWLYEICRTYAYSERAKKRRNRSENGDTIENYLFLSRLGSPLYVEKKDAESFDVNNSKRYSPNGGAVRVFIRETVLPRLRKRLGDDFRYKFHDLRATFGMNLTDTHLELVQRGEATLQEAREFVRTRMGHESSATTDLYLQYRQKMQLTRNIQEQYEAHLSDLMRTVTGHYAKDEYNNG